MHTKVRSKAIMAAPGNELYGCRCSARIGTFVGQPCSSPETNVMHHMDEMGGRGMGTKETDLAAIVVCHNCHRLLESPSIKEMDAMAESLPDLLLQLMRALVETQARLVDAGIIIVKDGKLI